MLSLVGDLLFIVSPDEFAFPILFFSLSHMAYAMRAGARLHYRMYCSLLLMGILLSINNFKVQAGLYSIMLVSNFIHAASFRSGHYFIGYCLFVLSDILLAYRDFITRYPGDDVLALTSYFLAQIVLSGPGTAAGWAGWTGAWTWTWTWTTLEIPWVPL